MSSDALDRLQALLDAASPQSDPIDIDPGDLRAGDRGNWYVLFLNLPIEDVDLPLGGGMTLRNVGGAITVFDLAAAGAAGFREWAVLDPIIRACTTEVESPADGGGDRGYDTLNRVWLVSAMLVLRGFVGHLPVAASAYSWRLVVGATRRPLPAFRGGLLDYRLRMIRFSDSRVDAVNPEDAIWLTQSFSTFDRLAADDTRFRFALECVVSWRYQHDARSAVAHLWSGIEALFSVGAELTFRVAVSAASLLEPRGAARTARFKSVQKLYARRSRVVHGDNIAEAETLQTCNDSFELLRDLLLHIASLGHVPTPDEVQTPIFE